MYRSLARLPVVVLATALALSCGGGSNSGTKPLPRRLYTCDDKYINSVSVYAVAEGGALTPIAGSPFATGGDGGGYAGQSNCIRIHAASRRLYAVNVDSVSIFSIDEESGGLTLLPGSPSPLGASAMASFYSLEISQDGEMVFAPDIANAKVYVASVGADGSLTEVAGSPFATSGGAAVAELGRGEYLYLQPSDSFIDAFRIGAGGALSMLAGSPYVYDPSDSGFTIRASPSGEKLAVGAGGVSVFTLAAASGQPTLAAGSPFDGPRTVGALAWSPDGARLYVGDWDGGYIYGYAVAADGVLTPLGGSPWTASFTMIQALTLSSQGDLLFASSFDEERLGVFAVDAAGAPTEVAGSPFDATGADVSHLIFTP